MEWKKGKLWQKFFLLLHLGRSEYTIFCYCEVELWLWTRFTIRYYNYFGIVWFTFDARFCYFVKRFIIRLVFHCVKVPIFRVFLVRVFPHIHRKGEISIISPYSVQKNWIQAFFTQCLLVARGMPKPLLFKCVFFFFFSRSLWFYVNLERSKNYAK